MAKVVLKPNMKSKTRGYWRKPWNASYLDWWGKHLVKWKCTAVYRCGGVYWEDWVWQILDGAFDDANESYDADQSTNDEYEYEYCGDALMSDSSEESS